LPRRLGDDPLARAKNAAAVQAARAMQTGEGFPMLAPRGSHNDVFFETRTSEAPPAPDVGSSEAPEISEVSSLPQVRDAPAGQRPASSASTAPPRSYLEELVSNLNSAQPASALASEAKPDGQAQRSGGGGLFRRLFGRR
jgi:hypothetical protein